MPGYARPEGASPTAQLHYQLVEFFSVESLGTGRTCYHEVSIFNIQAIIFIPLRQAVAMAHRIEIGLITSSCTCAQDMWKVDHAPFTESSLHYLLALAAAKLLHQCQAKSFIQLRGRPVGPGCIWFSCCRVASWPMPMWLLLFRLRRHRAPVWR